MPIATTSTNSYHIHEPLPNMAVASRHAHRAMLHALAASPSSSQQLTHDEPLHHLAHELISHAYSRRINFENSSTLIHRAGTGPGQVPPLPLATPPYFPYSHSHLSWRKLPGLPYLGPRLLLLFLLVALLFLLLLLLDGSSTLKLITQRRRKMPAHFRDEQGAGKRREFVLTVQQFAPAATPSPPADAPGG